MANNRAFCFKRGTLPVGTIAANGKNILGVQIDRNAPNGLLAQDATNKWWAGPNETVNEVRLFIAHPVPYEGLPSWNGNNNDQPPGTADGPWVGSTTPDAAQAGVGFWGSPTATNPLDTNEYIAIGNNAYKVVTGNPGTFTTDTDVRNWVISQGYWDNYGDPGFNTANPQTPDVQP